MLGAHRNRRSDRAHRGRATTPRILGTGYGEPALSLAIWRQNKGAFLSSIKTRDEPGQQRAG